MKIYTSYFAKASRLAKDGIVCISIARLSPKWFTGARFTFLAPSKRLLFDKSITDEEFENEYLREVCANLNPVLLKKEIEMVANGHDVALMCYEKPGDECHRHTLAKWMNRHGFDVTEYGQEEKRVETTIEQTLF